MTFKEALKILNIEDYGERIFNSNSHGELNHLMQYCTIADILEKSILKDTSFFRDWFEQLIKSVESKWDRPESIFQHVLKCFTDDIKAAKL